MNLQAIYHISKSNYCYVYKEETVHIRLRAAKADIAEVILIYGDKYNWHDNKEEVMRKLCSDSLFDYFMAEIKPANNRLAYFFKIISRDEKKLYYTEKGFCKKTDEKEIYFSFFQLPYMHKAEIHQTPEWVRDTVFYQIFPERFYNGDVGNDPVGVRKWGEKPTNAKFFGGDLKGIINKLDYLQGLGITAIYLTPIFDSPTSHKYDTSDYFKVDKCFGDTKTLKELVEKCHEKGIKVVLDAVFNHSGFLFAPFQDVIKKGAKSKYVDWFHIQALPIKTNPANYEAFAFVPNMPKLNTNNPEVKKYLLDVASYWIKEADIDGWRLDVADEVDHEFWREFRRTVKGLKSDAYIVGEIWGDALPWLKGDQFDAVMNYTFMKHCLDYFADNILNDQQFMALINEMRLKSTTQVNEVMLNLLDSHDTPRFLTRCKNDIKKLLLAATFQLTYDGTPCIYYGTEIGLDGEGDPDNRKTMIWDAEEWNNQIFNHYKNLIRIRSENSALRRGRFEWLEKQGEIIGYKRELREEKIIVLINNHRTAKKIILQGNDLYLDIISEQKINAAEIELAAYEARILKAV